MKFTNKITILITTVFLGGCQSDVTTLRKYEVALESKKPKAVLIAKVDNADYVDISQYVVSGKGRNYRIVQAPYLFVPYNYTKSVYEIDPGIYYFSYAFVYDTEFMDYTSCPGLTDQDRVAYGGFTVKAGDVIYLGDIKVIWSQRNPAKMIQLTDNLTSVKQDLAKEGFSDLAAKVRLVQMLPPGTKPEL